MKQEQKENDKPQRQENTVTVADQQGGREKTGLYTGARTDSRKKKLNRKKDCQNKTESKVNEQKKGKDEKTRTRDRNQEQQKEKDSN